MSGNLGMKPVFRQNDKRNIKPFKARPVRQKYCRVCSKPFNGGGNVCQSCRDFVERKQREERQAEK